MDDTAVPVAPSAAGDPRRRRSTRPRAHASWAGPALACVVAILLTPGVGHAQALTDPFPAPAGCAMAHCDPQMSDQADTAAPGTANVTSLWHDTAVKGAGLGLGCTANLAIAVCTFGQGFFKPVTLRAYRPDGTTLYSSSTLLDGNAYFSVPLVDAQGSAVVADDRRVLRLSPTGAVLWQTGVPGGIPTSANITDSGAVVVATLKGPLSAYDGVTGTLLAQLRLTATVSIDGVATAGYFDTINTASVLGNRIYIATQFRDLNGTARDRYGRLYAVDFDRGARAFNVAWFVDFRGPSGASPLVIVDGGVPTIYFDGTGPTPGTSSGTPQFIAVRDRGTTGEMAWRRTMQAQPQASAARDPRGGLWVFSPFYANLQRLDQTTGAVLQTISVDALVNQSGVHGPSSAMTITGTTSEPVMIVSGTPPFFGSSYVLAIDLATSRALWVRRVDESKGLGGVPFGEYPIVKRADGRPVVVFATNSNGVWGLGAP